MRNDELQRTANELRSLRAERDFLRKENDELVGKTSALAMDSGVEGFTRGVEACESKIRAQVL